MFERTIADQIPDEFAPPEPKVRSFLHTNWGLGPCDRPAECGVCVAIAHDYDRSELRHMRNLYVNGTEVWTIADSFGIRRKEVHRHARAKRWDTKRNWNLGSKRDEALWQWVKTRYQMFRHRATDETPDRMLELAGKMIGVGKTTATTEVEAGMSYERFLFRITQTKDDDQ